MNETAAISGATSETTSPDQPADPLTLDKVARTGNRALAFVRDFPWVGLGVLSTCLGVLILYAYFRSMGHVPADFAILLGAGVGIAGVTFAYLLVVVLALILPHAVFTQMESLKAAPWRPWPGSLKDANNLLIGAQWLSVGLLFSYSAWGLWRDCVPGLAYVLTPAVVLVVAGGAIVAHAGWRRAVWRWTTTGSFVQLLLLSSLPLLVLSDLLMPTGTTSEWDYLLWLLVWLTFIFVLGALPKEVPLWAVALVIPFLLPAALWLAPAMRGHGDLFPQRVMEMAGIRTTKAIELKVPQATCELIAATALFGPTGQAVTPCGAGTPWVTVRAQVLSNLGTRWWIEVQQVGDLAVDPAEVLRMSIPADGAQLVQRRPATTPERRSQCKATS
ncbi:hypothetical protein KBW71_23435 [Hydrogenophaga aromaticivorans]|uniref:hypothetical protein n=1 Tax=Hydrogenophaga aromaticivorans TaxID=2610898 RepID=UPI001B39450E|nr:hypothetical protein [Hydrogenophaga aromaticivorans]MBQ0921401.1 hypothetical protein [Hydrogenophaga aromaticivorans]